MRQARALRLPLLPVLSPIVATLLACGLLLAIYRAPYNRSYDVGSWIASAEQMYDIEEAGDLHYAFTKGASTLRFPELGQASYEVTLQLAGPGGTHPLDAGIDAGFGRIALGTFEGMRSVHLLGTVDRTADLRVRLDGPTVRIPPDVRPLGIMVARIGIDSLGGAVPPWTILLGAATTIALFWLALTLLHYSPRRRLAFVLLVAVGLAVSAALGRGQVLLVPLWLLLGAAGLLASGLIRGEASALMTSWRGILMLLAGWRVALFFIAALALRFERAVYAYGYDNTFQRDPALPERPTVWLNALIDAWMQWDALHYASIATRGYTFVNQTWPTIAFFPLYPLAIKALLPLTANNVPGAALLVSHLALLGAVLLLYLTISREWNRAIAYRCVVLLLCFPTAYFFISGYSEALALLLTAATIWALRRRSYWLAGIAGALLALTRVPGVLIGAAIAAAFVMQQEPPRRLKPQIIAAALPAFGLGLFMGYQQLRWGTPFAFLEAQQSWNNGSGPPWAIPLTLLTNIFTTPEAEIATFGLLVWAAILLLFVVALKRLPVAYSLSMLLLLPALLAQNPISLTRHVLPVVPLFLALALVTERVWIRWAILSIMIAGLAAMTALFVGGFFIA